MMLLSKVIEVWDLIHFKNVGELGFCDLEDAIDSVFGIENDCDPPQSPSPSFQKDLEALLNRHSEENGSGTPDWILAEYLVSCLKTFDQNVAIRYNWRSLFPENFDHLHQEGPSFLE